MATGKDLVDFWILKGRTSHTQAFQSYVIQCKIYLSLWNDVSVGTISFLCNETHKVEQGSHMLIDLIACY